MTGWSVRLRRTLATTALAALGALGATAASATEIAYTLSMESPQDHYFQVEMRVTDAPSGPQQLVLPVWTPGSYLVREYARNVTAASAVDDAGTPLPLRKLNKNTWQITPQGNTYTVRFKVYAHELGVQSSHLTAEHAYAVGASLFPYLDGHKDLPLTLSVRLSAPFAKLATGLPPVEGKVNTFRAANYDILIDSPLFAGNFAESTFTVDGIPHRLVVDGPGRVDLKRLTADTRKIVETQAKLFGGLPYQSYTFLMGLSPGGSGGGLEHLNSTFLLVPSDRFGPESEYRKVLGLISHEFFHLWNVKRIRPQGLGPFDYTREVYTNNLWVAEGVTSYYDDLFLRRAGLISPDAYLKLLADQVKSYRDKPGRFVQPLAEASFDAWIKYYRRDENSPNATISYYDKGALVGLMLDLEIRGRTGNRRSLDDAMRTLYQRFGQPGQPGYTDADIQKACEAAAGEPLTNFFADYVYGKRELDLEGALRRAGLRLKTELSKGEEEEAKPRPWLGIDVRSGSALIAGVVDGGPADRSGINAGDELVAIGEFKADASNYKKRLAPYAPGEEVKVAVFRDQALKILSVKLGREPDDKYQILPLESATPAQRAVYENWLGTKWKDKDKE